MVHKSEKIDFTTVLASCVHDMKNSITMLLGSISEIDSEGQSISATSREKLHRIQHEGHRVTETSFSCLHYTSSTENSIM